MPRNPYLAAWRVRRRNQHRTEGLPTRLARLGIGVVAAGLLVPLVQPVFLSFLSMDASRWGEGMENVLQRAGIALVAVLSLDVYTALIRGPDRAVLDLHPVDAGQVAVFEVVRTAWERAWLVPLVALLLAPVALGAPGLWALGVVAVTGAWLLGLVASGMVHLLAVDVAQSERWAPLMELLRGHNPRAQAAFLYAPGVVLAGAGSLVLLSAWGVRALWGGDPAGAVGLLLPYLAAVPCALAIPSLGRHAWLRASPVLAEIDARYAALAHPEEGRRVYLDWAVRWLPSRVALYALKDLRHGWRARRSWITGAWLAGIGAALVGWTGDPAAPLRAAAVAAGATWLFAAVGVLLDVDEPAFLRVWLPRGGAPRRTARVIVLLAWLQACIWLAVAAVAVRHGASDAALVLGAGEAASLLAAVLAMACGSLRERGPWVYAPVAAVAAAGTAALITGGAG